MQFTYCVELHAIFKASFDSPDFPLVVIIKTISPPPKSTNFQMTHVYCEVGNKVLTLCII